MNIVTVIQARLGSTRLPRKVLLPLQGKPLLVRMIERVRRSRLAGRLIVATTYLEEDLEIAGLCHQNGVGHHRGHPLNLLARHYEAALMTGADAVVKIPSDCPLIDPEIIDLVIEEFLSNHPGYDYVSNLHPSTFPDGNDVEIMSMEALHRALCESTEPHQFEHTTPYLFEQPGIFRQKNIMMPGGLNLWDKYRLTLDYPEDYELIRTVFEGLYPQNPEFGLADVIRFLDENPLVNDLNLAYRGQSWLKKHLANQM